MSTSAARTSPSASAAASGRTTVSASTSDRSRGPTCHAAPWTATEVSPEVVWAAIDCPGAWAVGGPGRGEIVLGRMAAEIVRLPEEGESCIVVAWPLGEDGRKLYAGTALFAAGRRAAGRRPPDLDSAQDGIAAAAVEAVGGKDRHADPAGPERVPAVCARSTWPRA